MAGAPEKLERTFFERLVFKLQKFRITPFVETGYAFGNVF